MDNPFAKYAKPEEENPFLRYAPSQEEKKEEENPFLKYSAPVEETPVAKGKPVSTTPEPSPDEPISVGQYASDYGKLFGAPAIQGVADLPQGLLDAAISVPRAFATGEAYERGPLIPRVLDKSVQLVRSLFGTSLTKQQEERLAGKIATDEFITEAKSLFELPRFFEYLSEEGGDVADKLRKSVSSRTRQKLEGSTPKGNFLEAAKTGDFSKLSFGDDPTLEGYAAHTVQVLGSLAPVIATAVITKGAPTPSAVVGGGMAGGEGAGEAREYVKSLSDGQLMEMSPYYANMRTAGIDEQKARKIISDRAAEQAAFLQGSVGALGGVFTGKLVTGKLDNYFTSNIRSRLGRIVALGGVGAAEEGTQEFLEGIAADVGIDKEVVKEIGAESFANLILGSLGGGAVGAGRGLVSPTPAGAKSKTEEDKAIAALDKLAADEEAEELKLEESILARANEIVGEFSDEGLTISMDDAYARARFELVEDKPEAGGVDLGLAGEKDLFAEETAKKEQLLKAIAEFPEEAQATPLESKQLIDKTLRKKLGRPPTDIETLEALYEFTQEKANRLRAESGGRKPPVSVPSGEEAAAGVTGAPARTEPTGLGEGVGAAASVGAREEPTTGALKPEDLELDAAIKSGDIDKLLSSGLVDYKEVDTLGPQGSLILARKRLDLRKKAAPTETKPAAPALPQAQPGEASMPIQRSRDASVTGVPMSLLTTPEALQRAAKVLSTDPNNVLEALNMAANRGGLAEWEAREIAFGPKDQAPTQEYEEALAETYKRRGLDKPDEASKKIQESRNVGKKVADAYVQALRKQDEERIKWSYGLGSEQAYREALREVEKIENRIRGVEKRREGKQPPSAKPTAPVEEPIRFRTVEDLSPEDRAAYESENAEIRASMKESTDAAKERGISFANAAAPFVDQLRTLDQKYGIGERISEGKTEIRGVRPARDEEEEAQTPGTDPVGFARAQAVNSFDRRNSLDYSDPEEAIDFGLDNLNDTLTEYGVTDPYIREQAVEAYKNEIARLQSEAATGVRPAKDEDISLIGDLDAELEQKAIELSLKVGDIHPTMVSAISNNDLNGALRIASQKLSGFSADLAKALLDLKLPTNISFNSGRDLVRRSIDGVSAQQQKRLFRYVEMHYPQVYDKYFKNYDRSESLEAVSKGLAELQKPNYNLGPVASEFQTVSEAYDKYIEGLTAPGAYYPQFDEIALDTNTLTGKSYRVFLHEVVHAATEYVLNTYGTNRQELTPGQREAVEELTKMYNYAVEKLGKEPYGMTNIYEFISEVFTNKKFQELLKGVQYEPKKTPFLSRLIKSILNAFGLDNLAGNAMAEATKIFSAVRTGAPLATQPRFAGGKRGKRVQGPVSSPQTSRTQEQSVQSYIGTMNLALKGRMTWSKAIKIMGNSFWDARNTQLRQVVLGFMNLSHLAEITQDKFPQIIGTIRLIEKMIEYRLSILNEAADISKRWTVAQFRNPRQSQLMSRIMLEATMRSLDPDDPKGQPVNAALLQAWATLKPEFKQIYRDVRNFYKKSVERMVKELEDRVNNSSLSQQEKEKALADIAAQFGPDKLVSPYFPLRRFGEFFFQVGSGNFKEFYEHESADARNLAMNNRIDELSKGNAQQRALVASVYPGNGVSELFSKNRSATGVLEEVQDLVDSIGNITTPPTKAQYDAAEKALQKELNRTPTKEEVEKRFERDQIKKELKDNLNQLLYVLLPQQSMRKMFINRKNIQGASEDMLRVFSTSAIHSAYQQSRFKFSDKLHNNITNALDDIRNNPLLSRSDKEVYRDFVIELEKRMPTILSAEDTSFGAKVAGRLSETTFFFMLSAPFSAMLNTIGMAQIALPYIGGTYGYDRTAKLMTKNMLRYTSTVPTRTIKPLIQGDFLEVKFPSLAEGYSFKNEPILHRAAFELAQEGQYEISLVNDFMMLAEAPSALYTGYMATIKKIMSGLFHQTERLNREVVSITVFEMAYEKFTTEPKKDARGVVERDAQGNPVMNTPEEAFQLAMAEAKDMVRASLGDFSRQMKPRYFVGPIGSIIFKFKQYPVLVTYILLRNLKLGFGPFRPLERKKLLAKYEEQLINDKVSPAVIKQRVAEYEAHHKAIGKEARRRMAGILAITYLLGGNEASPFYSIGLGLLVNMFADDEDDEFFDWENWVKNYVQVELGGAAGDLFAEMGMDPEVSDSLGDFIGDSIQKGVVSTITGGNFADRVSLDPVTMFYREGRYSPDVREGLIESMIANAGPTVGLGFNWVEAYKLMQEGQYQRAFEKAAPALFAKPVTAARLAEEGGKTARGDELVDEFSAWEIAMQSIGLQPVKLNTAQKASIEVVRKEQKLEARRKALMDRLWMERDNFDTFNDVLEEANEFSLKYPLFAIDSKAIKESFDQRAEDQAQANNIGARVSKKFIPEALQMLRYGKE